MAITPHPALPTGAATVIAARLATYRNSTCVIQRPNSGLDATGAPNSGVTTVATVGCGVRAPQRQPIESVGGGRFAAVVDYEVRFAPDVDVRSEDRIVVNGETLRVIADDEAKSHGFELIVKAKAVES